MVTIPPEPSSAPASHEHRDMAESFGTDAERYDRARLPYPDALIGRVAAGARTLLDVGCGTGIAARQFQALGLDVLGVEPDPRMAAFARRRGLATEVARFEDWDRAGRRFDAVAAAQAWHWVDPAAGAAKAAAALGPGGRFAAFWNVFHLPPEVAAVHGAAVRKALPDAPVDFAAGAAKADPYGAFTDAAAAGLAATGHFGAVETAGYEWAQPFTRETWLDQLPTSGLLTRLPADRLAPLLEEVAAGLDDAFTVPYTTVAVLAVRK